MILVVNLDLYGPATAYDPLYNALKKQGVWWHYMRWTWLVETNITPDQMVETLKPFKIKAEDRILVLRLTQPYQGLLTKEEWDWINTRMSPSHQKTGT